ncbi:hypothetical protein HRbin36_01325 [bacterium HR36]|nr:hypothetical protein HRbin36_01325 [bacterium HR36]
MTERKVAYVYQARLSPQQLQDLIRQWQCQVIISWDLARLDLSGELRENGTAFKEDLEVRWRKIGDTLSVLVLSDSALNHPDLRPVGGKWTRQAMHPENDPKSIPTLVALNDKRYKPLFTQYPIIQAEKGHLACELFYRDGVAMFVSPRRILPLEV